MRKWDEHHLTYGLTILPAACSNWDALSFVKGGLDTMHSTASITKCGAMSELRWVPIYYPWLVSNHLPPFMIIVNFSIFSVDFCFHSPSLNSFISYGIHSCLVPLPNFPCLDSSFSLQLWSRISRSTGNQFTYPYFLCSDLPFCGPSRFFCISISLHFRPMFLLILSHHWCPPSLG